jgi:hypothetical protein
MLIKPARMDIPLSVAVADASAVVLVVDELDVLESPATPRREDELAKGFPVLVEGAEPALAADPAVGTSFPNVAVAVLPDACEFVSIFTPGSSVEAVFGLCG